MSKRTGRGRRGWITKNIRSRTKRMIASLEDRGVTHAAIAKHVGYSRSSSVSLMKGGYITFSREKYEALRALYRETYPNGQPTVEVEVFGNAGIGTTQHAGGPATVSEGPSTNGTPTQYVAEALADLDQAQLLFSSARRRIQMAEMRTEELAAKIREVGLN